MYRIRKTKTASGKTAVQVVTYRDGQTIVHKHFGSTGNEDELLKMGQTAREWSNKKNYQPELFEENNSSISTWIETSKLSHLKSQPLLLYQVLCQYIGLLGFAKIIDIKIRDLVVMRLIEPVSKLRSLQLLAEYFDIYHSKNSMYESVLSLKKLQGEIESAAVNFASENLDFNFNMVFYDVTTLYFESFKSDADELRDKQKLTVKGLRKCGFSKDNKFNQPQIVIGLMVNNQGFPLSVQIFSGNTFEGHTFIPSVLRLKHKYNLKQLTVVADAAMISKINVEALIEQDLQYIVGARLGNLSPVIIDNIHKQLHNEDGKGVNDKTFRLKTTKGDLICSFSDKRYQKDKSQMKKQLEKAKLLLKQPGKINPRIKFVKQSKSNANPTATLNSELIKKTKQLLGIKGYYTNLTDCSDEEVIGHYHKLWQVEKSFRMAKTDLQMRPLYHYTKNAIKGHISICFMAICVAKFLELKSNTSINRIIHQLKGITDSFIEYQTTGEILRLRKQLTKEEVSLLDKIGATY